MITLLTMLGIPFFFGLFLCCNRNITNRKTLLSIVGLGFVATAVVTVFSWTRVLEQEITVFWLTQNLPLMFHLDQIGLLFSILALVVFLCAGFFSFSYMEHEKKERRYYGFYFLVLAILQGLCFAGNMVTYYLFFELLTLSSLPLVMQENTKEAIMAGLKYLFYSLCGAYFCLFGFYILFQNESTISFLRGGNLLADSIVAHPVLLQVAATCMIFGFSVKAGMFPMHGWLPTAHPVAPAPASAALSAVIVKAGVLGIIRVIYYQFGTSFLQGTKVQTLFLSLSLITVFMGSLLAYGEPVLKKRLAYSTVSQVSYILFGLFLLQGTAFTGSMLHVLGHGFMKASLFLCAGAIIHLTGKSRVEEFTGLGKEMPILLWCFTISSLGLIGIPPTGGFLSKWYLAIGALDSKIPFFSYVGPVVLLLSALLTAGYLLPITVKGFLPGAEFDAEKITKKEPNLWMLLPVLILTVLSVLMGVLPNGLLGFLGSVFR